MSSFREIRDRAEGRIARDDLAILLENEAYLAAADKIRCGQDAVPVLNELRPFVMRYNDEESRNAVITFRRVVAGELKVA